MIYEFWSDKQYNIIDNLLNFYNCYQYCII